jgi:hypothetical protein
MTTELSNSTLESLLKIAEKATAAEHVEGCPDCRKVMREFNKEFTPAKSLSLVKELISLRAECERLRQLIDTPRTVF